MRCTSFKFSATATRPGSVVPWAASSTPSRAANQRIPRHRLRILLQSHALRHRSLATFIPRNGVTRQAAQSAVPFGRTSSFSSPIMNWSSAIFRDQTASPSLIADPTGTFVLPSNCTTAPSTLLTPILTSTIPTRSRLPSRSSASYCWYRPNRHLLPRSRRWLDHRSRCESLPSQPDRRLHH
jgi:hypothetical protein